MALASSWHLDDQPLDPHQPDSHSAPTVRVDRTDDSGNVIGYSLITETEWDSTIETYDLDHNLISSSYTNQHGYSQHSTWDVLLDATGAVAGQRYTSVSSDGSYSDQSVELYDTEGNLLSSTYNSSDGSWQTSTRVAPPDLSIGPAPLSHALQISGAWADGSTYERSELYDINGNLVRSESVHGDGASELYTIEPVFNDDGSIQGYQGTWTWSDPDGEVSSFSEHFDTDLNPIWHPHPNDTRSQDFTEDGLHLSAPLDTPSESPSSYSNTTISENKASDNISSNLPFITSKQSDLKLNVDGYRDATHGMLLGKLDLTLRGNRLDNVLVGNSGNNRIAGGRGKDMITGGGGEDHFAFRKQRSSGDTITDFNTGEDKFLLMGREFRNLFNASGLRNNVVGEVLWFDQATGHLLFSPTGEASGSRPIKLALVQGLEAADFSRDLFLFG
jgi:hypothetical protein